MNKKKKLLREVMEQIAPLGVQFFDRKAGTLERCQPLPSEGSHRADFWRNYIEQFMSQFPGLVLNEPLHHQTPSPLVPGEVSDGGHNLFKRIPSFPLLSVNPRQPALSRRWVAQPRLN